jgi:hypothetical protein
MNNQNNQIKDFQKVKSFSNIFKGSRKKVKFVRLILSVGAVLVLWLIGKAIDLFFDLVSWLIQSIF